MTTRKQRKGPTASATLFSVGTVRTGNDGCRWMVEANKNGVHRWVRTKNYKRQTRKNVVADITKKVDRYAMFDVYYTIGKEGADPFMKEDALYDVEWRMGFASKKDSGYVISFDGPPESKDTAKAIVKKEYEKIKKRGAIKSFNIKNIS